MSGSKRSYLIVLALVVACDDPAAPDTTIHRVDLSTSAIIIGPGERVQLTATPRTAAGTPVTDRQVTWSVQPAGIATVSAAGLLEGLAFGAALLTASVDDKSATASINVVPTAPRHLAAAWRMESFDGLTVPATYALFFDEPVGGGIVGRVEIRLDSATKVMTEAATYQRRYCFTELHDNVVMYRYCWGDHGTFTLGNALPVSLRLTSEYIQNLFTPGQVMGDGRLTLSEELWIGETRRTTIWTRR